MVRDATLWQQLKGAGAETARDELIEQNLPLVRYVLGRMALTLPAHLETEDLAEAGVIGLIRAVEEFDPSRQTQFSTFAVPRIRGAILDELRAHDWVPRSARRKAAEVTEAYNALRKRHQQLPSIDDVARKMKVSVDDVRKMLGHANTATFSSLESLQETDRAGNRSRLSEGLEDQRHRLPAAEAELEEQEELLTQGIMQLPYQERLVITLYYYKQMMLKEIAEVLRVSKPRVSQIHNKAIDLLKQWVDARVGVRRTPATEDQRPGGEAGFSLERLFGQARLIAEGKA